MPGSAEVKSLDLFSCVGLHALGCARAGIETIGFCELNPYRRAVLARQFPEIPIHADVRSFDGLPADIVIGGPPCQRTSVAAAIHGRRTGESLWSEMLRVGLNVGAEWFVVEQPPGNAKWEAEVAGDLARAGYHVARSEFAACDVGAPHIRRRVFILAHPCLSRLEVAWATVPQEIDRVARATSSGNHWRAGVPGTMRVANGRPGSLDGIAAAAVRGEVNDRAERIEAIGDSNPPQMAEVIGRAIMAAHTA